nr:unnamed protein product [Spirometra erinaceieuropaei]
MTEVLTASKSDLAAADDDDVNQASCLWPRLIAGEVEHLKSLGDPLGLLRPGVEQCKTGPADYFCRLTAYLEEPPSGRPTCTPALLSLRSFVSDLSSGLIEYKSRRRARACRLRGNEFFKVKDYESAAHHYQRGLLYAQHAFPMKDYDNKHPLSRESCSKEKETEEAALLHGNLSAVHFHRAKWIECAWSACLALELHGSASATTAVIRRLTARLRQACSHLGHTLPDPLTTSDLHSLHRWITEYVGGPHGVVVEELQPDGCSLYGDVCTPEPRYGRNPDLYAFSNGLRVQSSPEQGRFVVASSSFAAGDVLASEPAGGWSKTETMRADVQAAACCLLLPFQRHVTCSACHSHLTSVGFVCPNCTDAAFCGPPSDCFRKHLRSSCDFMVPEWHKAECRVIFLLNSIGLGHLCFRLAYLRLTGVLSPPPQPSSSDPGLRPIITLDSLVDHFSDFPSLFEYALTGWLLQILLQATLGVKVSGQLDCFSGQTIGQWCFDMLRRLQCNAHAVTEVGPGSYSPRAALASGHDGGRGGGAVCAFGQNRIAGGLYPEVSLINHACQPNVSYQFHKGFLIIRCIRDLAEGDEICACYGPHYLHNPSTEARRRALQEQYFFVCQCRHCLQGEPPQMSPAQSERWLDLVERLNNEHSVRRIRDLIDKLRSLSSGIVLFPEGLTFGSVLDSTGRRLLETRPTDDVSLKLGRRLVCESVAWVRDRFGADSTEYAWELTKLASLGGGDLCETNDFNLPSTREQAHAVFQTIMTLHYGQEEARRILRSFLDERGSVSASSL